MMTWVMKCHIARKPKSCLYMYENNCYWDKIIEYFNQMYYSSMSCKMIFFCAILIYWKRKDMGIHSEHKISMCKQLPVITRNSAFIAVELHFKVTVRPTSGSVKKTLNSLIPAKLWNLQKRVISPSEISRTVLLAWETSPRNWRVGRHESLQVKECT